MSKKIPVKRLYENQKILNAEVKNVKTFEGHDADQMSCTLYVDGKKVAKVLDDSWGGEFQYEVLNKKLWESFLENIKKVPDVYFNNINLSYNADMIIEELVAIYQEDKILKKETKNNIVIRYEEDEYEIGNYISFAVKYSDELHQKINEIAKRDGKTAIIYNENMSWNK